MIPVSDRPTTLEYFQLYITDELVDIITETNRYAKQYYIAQHVRDLKPLFSDTFSGKKLAMQK